MPVRRRPAEPDPVAVTRLDALRRPARGWVPEAPALPELLPETPDPEVVDGDQAADPGREAGPPATGRSDPADGLLDRWRGARVDPGRHGLVALAVVVAVVVVVTVLVVLRARPSAVAVPDVVRPGAPMTAPSASAAAPDVVVVDVAGKVARPGLVRLPGGSRVADAVEAAGGALPGADLTGLNLARRLGDGEQLLVGLPQPPGGTGPAGAVPGDGKVDLNTATAEQLDALPGLGPVLAQHVVDWRTEHGRFASVEQLREVSGIGESKYAELKDRVRV